MQNLGRISKMLVWPGLLAGLLLAATALAQSSSPDVGLVTRLEGKATYRNSQEKKPAAVKAFMKVRQGDNLKLAKGSSLTLLYFAGGRQEAWKAVFMAEVSASKAKGKKAALPEIKMMPASAIKKIAGAPFLLARADAGPAGATQMPRMAPGRSGITAMKSMTPAGRSGATPMMEKAPPGRSGAIQTMAPVCKLPPPGPSPEKARKMLKEAQTVYQDLKKQAGPGDFTPELYYLGVLAECRKYSEMNKMLDGMLQKKPGDAALLQMKTWVRNQTLCGG